MPPRGVQPCMAYLLPTYCASLLLQRWHLPLCYLAPYETSLAQTLTVLILYSKAVACCRKLSCPSIGHALRFLTIRGCQLHMFVHHTPHTTLTHTRGCTHRQWPIVYCCVTPHAFLGPGLWPDLPQAHETKRQADKRPHKLSCAAAAAGVGARGVPVIGPLVDY